MVSRMRAWLMKPMYGIRAKLLLGFWFLGGSFGGALGVMLEHNGHTLTALGSLIALLVIGNLLCMTWKGEKGHERIYFE